MPHKIRDKKVWVFDLDNTLYPAECNLFQQIDVHMGEFIQRLLSLDPIEARKIQKKYLVEYGTTLKGLMANHDVDPHDFLDKVHNIDFSPIQKDVRLRSALERLDGRKLVFTNADLQYSEQVLDRLGIADQFEGIFDIHAADLEPKPKLASYEKFARTFEIDPTHAVMFEDMAQNLIPAHSLGMSTVWIDTGSEWGDPGQDKDHIHYETNSLSSWLDSFTKDNS
ncbi:pyrimidine 5'-nucleotidase [Kordiimonas sediminis]|uniref:Pyrimidine 5'-nucleotidase n=1 Tax=Kordiimonas sediminis TaxID=1735581 RepID=A0A919E4F1_9PROT|nr:pyrimidine 5'-nucleotidase [Kordiimonas sediminis]GHF11955.1 pyrimidine 5'-nucleotidase [Kordiimonas sediminis]